MKENYRKLLLPTVYVGVAVLLMMGVVLLLSGISRYLNEGINYKYTLDNVFEDTIPVVNIESNGNIIKPYIKETVEIGKYFYDFESDSKEQESSIIYYENTYMQNSGVDYVDAEEFDVVSVLDGEVASVETNDIYGTIITIKHTDNLVTVYSSVSNVLVNTGYKVSQGEIIATSSKTALNSEKSTLHFEVYYNNEVLDPETLYTLSIEDFR